MCKELNEGGMMKSDNLNLKSCTDHRVVRMYRICCMDSGNENIEKTAISAFRCLVLPLPLTFCEERLQSAQTVLNYDR